MSTYALIVKDTFLHNIHGVYKDKMHATMNTISISNAIEPLPEFRRKSADFVELLKKEKQPIVLRQHRQSVAALMHVAE